MTYDQQLRTSRNDERRVEDFLRVHGFQLDRFSREHMAEKTPDYEVTGRPGDFFYCEVKSILTPTHNDGLMHSTRQNSLTKNIRDAAKQFRSVNSARLVPNVLAWCSHNFKIDFQDLLDLIDGKVVVEDRQIADLARYRFGRVRADLKEIDLHIWFSSNGDPGFLFVKSRSHLMAQIQRSMQRVLGTLHA